MAKMNANPERNAVFAYEAINALLRGICLDNVRNIKVAKGKKSQADTADHGDADHKANAHGEERDPRLQANNIPVSLNGPETGGQAVGGPGSLSGPGSDDQGPSPLDETDSTIPEGHHTVAHTVVGPGSLSSPVLKARLMHS
ncbi:hypothetical protein FN846DRAFT_903732 [Sphaerosporella brunnea]|uniref:Uncharacterized protein n=1 Tax=Sphaerosporella brunnea TaxID=1250544 RepID=A0A5J5F6V3_9PEZI|nr:hypothetical protein FN846DRAFT_903732 [Sphaerosporella brunnea]